MAYKNLLNRTCSWTRQSADGSVNEWGEEETSVDTIATNRPCRLEKLYDRELVEAYVGGDHDKGIYCLYLNIDENIRASDVVTIDGVVEDFEHNFGDGVNELIVLDVEDAGGGKHHHLQCFCRYRKEISDE